MLRVAGLASILGFVTQPSSLRAEATRNGWLIDGEIDRHDPETLAIALDQVTATIAGKGGGRAEFWIHDVADGDDAGPKAANFTPYRDLYQLRVALPIAAPASDDVVRRLDVRSFRSADLDAFIETNNRAFSWHPEQGGLTRRDVEATMGEPWFRPDGFLLHERTPVGGQADAAAQQLAGFCWTKIHEPTTTDPRVGEIYVIAVHPDFHGHGLGVPMTMEGLHWLADQGIAIGMLYVESNNDAANATYKRIGFHRHQTDRAYQAHIDPIG